MHLQPTSPGPKNRSYSCSRLSTRTRAVLCSAFTVTLMTALSLSAAAQAVKTASPPPPELSRFDIYGGYGYLHPVNSDIFNVKYQPINPGAVVSAAGYF